MRYLYILSDDEGQCVFPCDNRELSYYFKTKEQFDAILESWPSNSHGPAFPMNKYKGTIVLDSDSSDDPAKPLTMREIKNIVGVTEWEAYKLN